MERHWGAVWLSTPAPSVFPHLCICYKTEWRLLWPGIALVTGKNKPFCLPVLSLPSLSACSQPFLLLRMQHKAGRVCAYYLCHWWCFLMSMSVLCGTTVFKSWEKNNFFKTKNNNNKKTKNKTKKKKKRNYFQKNLYHQEILGKKRLYSKGRKRVLFLLTAHFTTSFWG